MTVWIRRLLLGTVFTTGAAVLIMEVAAVRMLSPYFGSSLYVLSSVLTVVLFALAVGYYVGGRLSDRFPYHVPLYVIVTLGGLSLLLLTLAAVLWLPGAGPILPLLIGPLFFSFALFFIPAFLLGIDSPYVIKLLSQDVDEEHRGAVVGSTFFWSTAGSIAGSLASGFILIPTFGIRETMVGTGSVLVVLGVGGGFLIRHLLKRRPPYDSRNDLRFSPVAGGAIFLLVLVAYVTLGRETHAGSLYARDGRYSHIHIFDGQYRGQATRFLKRDTNDSSARYLHSDWLVYPYTQFAYLYEALLPDAATFLMLGGGAYSIPRALHLADPELEIHVSEIEPVLFELAHAYFDLPRSENIHNHVVDARAYLARSERRYDLIFVDVFSTGIFVPPHLVTREFLELVRSRLSEEGVLMVNFITTPPARPGRSLAGSYTKTFLDVFPDTRIFATRLTHVHLPQTIVYIASRRDGSLDVPLDFTLETPLGDFALRELEIDPLRMVGRRDLAFTDNHAPVETLLLKERLFTF